MDTRNLEPKAVWNHFEDLNAVPRPSKQEGRVIAFMQKFGESLGLPTYTDPAGNVIIKKPASAGLENRIQVILQGHLDMVHQKNADTNFDFDTQGIQSVIDGDWVKAKGTTLGADNGMGVAAIMALLADKNAVHPALEALFTIDEETGMSGAFALEKGKLDGKILLNLDTEDDDEFSIGCAGGIDTNTRCNFTTVTPAPNTNAFQISVRGLKGGHSGVDIHLGRGNANKIMNRLMGGTASWGMQIATLDGGSLRNAIPRESFAIVVLRDATYLTEFEKRKKELQAEFELEDPHLKIEIQGCPMPTNVLSLADTEKVVYAIQAVHNGVYRMSPAIPGLVETSSSLARVKLADGEFITQSLQRSSIESGKQDIAHTIGAAFHLINAVVEHTGSYPGWEPHPDSAILKVMKEKYTQIFGEAPKVMAIHAGLECGIIGERYPGLDMISFGPTIKNPHSPDEKVNIPSVQKFWKFLNEVLRSIPEKS